MNWLYNRFVVLGVFVIGMSLIPLNDALMKQLSDSISVFEFLVMRGGFMLMGALCIPMTYIALQEVGWLGLLQVFLRGTLLVLTLTLLFLSVSMVKPPIMIIISPRIVTMSCVSPSIITPHIAARGKAMYSIGATKLASATR